VAAIIAAAAAVAAAAIVVVAAAVTVEAVGEIPAAEPVVVAGNILETNIGSRINYSQRGNESCLSVEFLKSPFLYHFSSLKIFSGKGINLSVARSVYYGIEKMRFLF
jgi:hypothetical protein